MSARAGPAQARCGGGTPLSWPRVLPAWPAPGKGGGVLPYPDNGGSCADTFSERNCSPAFATLWPRYHCQLYNNGSPRKFLLYQRHFYGSSPQGPHRG